MQTNLITQIQNVNDPTRYQARAGVSKTSILFKGVATLLEPPPPLTPESR